MVSLLEEVTVVPNDIWKNATKATIKNGDEILKEDVPVERLLYTKATLNVWKEIDPKGMVFLNQEPLPEDNDPVILPLQASTGDIIENVVVKREGQWATGIVAMFWSEQQ